MYAVIRTGGKQYRVAPEDVIEVEKVAGEAGEIVQFGEVLMLGGDKPQVGAPLIDGASVAGEVVEQTRGEKIIVFKKKRRKSYRRKKGHCQHLTAVRITEILTGGKKPSKAADKAPAKKAEDKPKAETKKPATKKAEAKPKAKAPAKKAEAKKPATKKAPAKKPAAKKPAAKK